MARKCDYGIDAPGVRRAMFLAGIAGFGLTFAGKWFAIPGWLIATYGLFMGAYMTWGSRVGKLRTREKLLDLAGTLRPWRGEDQSDNSPEATLANAALEGVSERVRIDTGDARLLPYPDVSFDVVLSHWVVYNLLARPDRERVLDEMVRVLRPGGLLILADIANIAEYREHLLRKDVSQLILLDGGLEPALMGVLSGGSYRPQALIGVRPW